MSTFVSHHQIPKSVFHCLIAHAEAQKLFIDAMFYDSWDDVAEELKLFLPELTSEVLDSYLSDNSFDWEGGMYVAHHLLSGQAMYHGYVPHSVPDFIVKDNDGMLLANAVFGGHFLHDDNYIKIFSPDETQELSMALEEILRTDLQQRADILNVTNCDESIAEEVKGLANYYKEAFQAGNAVLVYISD